MLRRKGQRILVTSSQELGLLTIVMTIDWTNSVNDMSRRQISTSGDHRLAGRQSLRILCFPDLLAGRQNRWTTGAMNRAINATTAQQSRVGCVHDCIDVQMCDVSNDDNHALVEKPCFSSNHWIRSQVGILLVTQLRLAA